MSVEIIFWSTLGRFFRTTSVRIFWSTADKTIFRPMLVRIFWPILVEKHHRPKSQKKLVDVDQNIPPIDVDQKTLVDVNKKNL